MSSKNETAQSSNNQPLLEKKSTNSNLINISNNVVKENSSNTQMNAPREITITASSSSDSNNFNNTDPENQSQNQNADNTHSSNSNKTSKFQQNYKSKYDKFDSLVPPMGRSDSSNSRDLSTNSNRKINNNPLIYPSLANSNHSYRSSIASALQRFYKTSIINLELKTLVIQYIAKTGDLPILSEEEVNNIPKLKFGQHLYKSDRGERYCLGFFIIQKIHNIMIRLITHYPP